METSNTVYKCYFDPKNIFLDEICLNNQKNTRYCPEAFPGVRIHGKFATYLVFQKGCCLILGLSNTKNLRRAFAELYYYIMDSARKKRSRDTISRYIWDLSDKGIIINKEKIFIFASYTTPSSYLIKT